MLQVEGGPDSFLPPESSKGWAGRLYMCLVPSTTSRPYPLPPNPFSNRYGSKLREKNLANGVDFLWVACFLGPSRATWCAPKRPKQHLKHWGGVEWAGGQGWQVKFLELNCSYNFNLLWWSKDQMVDLQDLCCMCNYFQTRLNGSIFTTPKRVSEKASSKMPTVVNGPRFVLHKCDPNLQLVTLGVLTSILHVALEVLLGV